MDIIPWRFSTGYCHITLDNIVDVVVPLLREWFPDTENTFQIDNLPTNGSEAFNWCLTGRHAILAGLVYMKRDFIERNTKMDIITASSVYNKGITKGTDHAVYTAYNKYALAFSGGEDHPMRIFRFFNSTRYRFNNGVNATSRFWRTLQ